MHIKGKNNFNDAYTSSFPSSVASRKIWSAKGLVHSGSFSSAKDSGIVSPVSRFFMMTCSKISYKKNEKK